MLESGGAGRGGGRMVKGAILQATCGERQDRTQRKGGWVYPDEARGINWSERGCKKKC